MRFASCVAAAAVFALICPASAQKPGLPDFAPDARTGWIVGVPEGKTPTGQDYLPPESGPGPVTNDPGPLSGGR